MNTAIHDPIFAAIESHRQAEAAWAAAADEASEEHFQELGDISWKQLTALLPMTPTSVAGCVAMLRHIAEYAAAYNQNLLEHYREDAKEPASTLLMRIAAALENPAA